MLSLRIGGWTNIVIGVGHLVGLLWAREFFYWTGVGADMERLADVHTLLPYALTVIVASFFIGFGLYALSGAGDLRPLPLLRSVIVAIAGVYLLRGLSGIAFQTEGGSLLSLLEVAYSAVALLVGLCFAFGAWSLLRGKSAAAPTGQ
jgi:hypothetical protein